MYKGVMTLHYLITLFPLFRSTPQGPKSPSKIRIPPTNQLTIQLLLFLLMKLPMRRFPLKHVEQERKTRVRLEKTKTSRFLPLELPCNIQSMSFQHSKGRTGQPSARSAASTFRCGWRTHTNASCRITSEWPSPWTRRYVNLFDLRLALVVSNNTLIVLVLRTLIFSIATSLLGTYGYKRLNVLTNLLFVHLTLGNEHEEVRLWRA